MTYPKDNRKALDYNKEKFNVDGFDGNLSGQLRYIMDPNMPLCLKQFNVDLYKYIHEKL